MTTPFPFVAGQVLTAAQLNSISELPIRTLTATGNAVAADRYSRVILNGSSISYTVNSATFDVGEVVHLYNINSTAATIAAGTGGVTINAAAGLTLAQYQAATLYAVSSTSFILWKTAVTITSGVIQVKSVTKTDTFTTTSTTFTDLTGLSVSITPTSASNKVLVFYDVQAQGLAGTNMGGLVLVRDSTTILQADAAGSRARTASVIPEAGAAIIQQVGNSYLDSPATTSATTYKLQIRTLGSASTTIYVNRTITDTDAAAWGRGTSSLTVMEVAP